MRRKRPRSSKLLFALALVVATGATLFLRDHLLRLEAEALAAGPESPVVVADQDMSRGTVVVDTSSLSVRSMPSAHVPPGALSSVEAVAGRMLASDVVAGEALTEARLAGAGGPVASLVPPGLRAAVVPVAAPSGLLASGDRVDVLATYAGGQPHTETVVVAAEVLSILSAGPDSFEGLSSLVLLVSPDDAESLAYARAFADLSVAVTGATEVG